MKQFSDDMRTTAHNAIQQMSAGCKDALGRYWNLFNGLDSLLGKTDPSNVNAVKFYDGYTNSDVKGTSLNAFGWPVDVSVGQFFADNPTVYGLTSETGNKSLNDIVLSG
jgi:hypothetical protein